MFVPLTEVVTCPTCGPEWSLVLLADRVAERRVLDGRFGCPNCRETFDVSGGFADLRPAGRGPEPDAGPAAPADGRDEAVRLAALMGLVPGVPRALLIGPAAACAPALAALMEGLEVVVVGTATAAWRESAGVSRFAAAGRLPFRDWSMGGVTLSGGATDAFLKEGARVLSQAGRIVLEDVSERTESRLRDAGLEIVAREGATIIARRAPFVV